MNGTIRRICHFADKRSGKRRKNGLRFDLDGGGIGGEGDEDWDMNDIRGYDRSPESTLKYI